MSEFKAIETQEELDKIIEARLARQKETFEKQLSDLEKTQQTNAELQKALEDAKNSTSDYEKQVSDLNSKVAGYELSNLKTKIALQNGLPLSWADRLKGDDEESLQADAQSLAPEVSTGSNAVEVPLKDTDPAPSHDGLSATTDKAYSSLLEGLNLKGE